MLLNIRLISFFNSIYVFYLPFGFFLGFIILLEVINIFFFNVPVNYNYSDDFLLHMLDEYR